MLQTYRGLQILELAEWGKLSLIKKTQFRKQRVSGNCVVGSGTWMWGSANWMNEFGRMWKDPETE